MFDTYQRQVVIVRRNHRNALSPLRGFYIQTGSLPRAHARGYLLSPLRGSLGGPVSIDRMRGYSDS